jgi:transcription elongation factor GreB
LAETNRYITPQGYKKVEEERERLWTVERPKVTAMVSAAAAEGDRSENAEYIYGKKRLIEIDKRIHALDKLLESLTIVEPRQSGDQVYFGAWVTIEDEDGKQNTYRIVGPDESDATSRQISMESPMARALMGKKVGEWITVKRPAGEADFLILEIKYRA